MSQIQYNTAKPHLVMSEYGRIIQEMVQFCMTVEDRDERFRCAQAIVGIMASNRQEKAKSPEVQQKLWNHLALMSGYQLDIDYPVEINYPTEVSNHREALSLPQGKVHRRHYGRLVEQALECLKGMPEGEERDALVRMTANRMKQNLFTWNPDVMSEEKVKSDMEAYAPDQKLTTALDGYQFASLHTLPTSILKRKNKK